MVITAATTYALVKFWLPLVTAASLAVKGFLILKSRMSAVASTFLDNHMHHIQDSAERAAVAVVELTSYHKENTELQKKMLNELTGLRTDTATTAKEMLATQHEIVTSLEVLKDRTN